MRNTLILLAIALGVGACAAAPDDSATICTANAVIGIWVHVTDSATGAALRGVRGEARAGAYSDSLQDDGAAEAVYIAAIEHAGTFSIHLEHPGYAPLDLHDVVVTRGVCHVVPAVRYAALRPLTP